MIVEANLHLYKQIILENAYMILQAKKLRRILLKQKETRSPTPNYIIWTLKDFLQEN